MTIVGVVSAGAMGAEMEEMSAAFDAASLPPGVHHGAAEIYGALEHRKDVGGASLSDGPVDLVGWPGRPT